jgi:hypothetical protein
MYLNLRIIAVGFLERKHSNIGHKPCCPEKAGHKKDSFSILCIREEIFWGAPIFPSADIRKAYQINSKLWLKNS